jgi:hypothetical protein
MSDWFADFLQMHHNASPEDYEPTETPGYWRTKKPCGGYPQCREPLHTYLFNEEGIRHTVYFEDCQRVKGKFAPKEIRFQSWFESCQQEAHAWKA